MRYTQPQSGPVQIDQGNLITNGLIAAAIPHLLFEAVNKKAFTQFGAYSSAAGTPGVGLVTNGSSNNIYVPLPTVTLTAWTIFALVKSSTAAADSRAVNFGLSTNDDRYIQVGVENTGTTRVRVLAQGNGATLPANQTSVGVGFNGVPHFVVLTYDGQNVRCYIDGILDTVAPTFTGALWTINQLSVGAMQRVGGSAFYAGSTYLAGGHNRALSAIEVKSLAANPWQLFRSPQRVMLVAASPDVIVALTGQATTAAAGTVSPSAAAPVAGNMATAASGTVVMSASAALSGNAATASSGMPSPGSATALAGNVATAAGGVVSAGGDVTVALGGQVSTASGGALSASSAASLAGQTAAASVGALLAGIGTTLIGSPATILQGSVTPVGDVTVALTGMAVIVTRGNVATVAPPVTSGGGAGDWRSARDFADRLDKASRPPKPTKAAKKIRREQLEIVALELLPDLPAARLIAPVIAQAVYRKEAAAVARWTPPQAMLPVIKPNASAVEQAAALEAEALAAEFDAAEAIRAMVEQWQKNEAIARELEREAEEESEIEMLLLG